MENETVKQRLEELWPAIKEGLEIIISLTANKWVKAICKIIEDLVTELTA